MTRFQLNGRPVEFEGDAEMPRAWIEEDVAQCGYCQADPGLLSTGSGAVLHPDGQRLDYGAMAEQRRGLRRYGRSPTQEAGGLPHHWPPDAHRRCGGDRPGRARYGLDATLPGALVAVVERCPYFSGGLASYDASATRAVPGVREVLVLPGPKPGEALSANLATGVAVIATRRR